MSTNEKSGSDQNQPPPPAGYNQPQPGYGQPQQGYGQQQPGYGQQHPGYGQQQHHSTVVVGQPANVVVVHRPNSYLGCAVFTCLCCFWPTGIAAIVFACMSQSSSDRQDYSKAQEEGSMAKIFSIISLVIGLVWIIAVIIYVIVVFVVFAEAVSAATSGSSFG